MVGKLEIWGDFQRLFWEKKEGDKKNMKNEETSEMDGPHQNLVLIFETIFHFTKFLLFFQNKIGQGLMKKFIKSTGNIISHYTVLSFL